MSNIQLDFLNFKRACKPDKTLDIGKDADKQYYIDFSSVRGGEIIEEVKQIITLSADDDDRTCQLFTGHIGCGKSTELLRLKAELEEEDFHVVYFESSQDLDLVDVRISDILMAIAGRISESLEDIEIKLKPGFFEKLFTDTVNLLNTPLELSGELSLKIVKLAAKTKENPQERNQLREYLETRTSPLLESINEEILAKAAKELKRKYNKQGLVVIVDNLDRVGNKSLPGGRTQPEYLFIDQGSQLGGLNCHVVYTIPLPLIFSSEIDALKQRLGGGVAPKVLPMVPAQLKDGSECAEGMKLLRQMVMARAFPTLSEQERINRISEVFDSPHTLDRLCRVSGGHVRNLMALLFSCCLKTKNPPITGDCLEKVIREERNTRMATIIEPQWELLRQVKQSKKIVGSNPEYQNLLRSLLVYEYRNDDAGHWFDINPVLAEADELQP
ncbi:MAG: P-loop NTPase fold protein [Cyanobacteriota bacterium]